MSTDLYDAVPFKEKDEDHDPDTCIECRLREVLRDYGADPDNPEQFDYPRVMTALASIIADCLRGPDTEERIEEWHRNLLLVIDHKEKREREREEGLDPDEHKSKTEAFH